MPVEAAAASAAEAELAELRALAPAVEAKVREWLRRAEAVPADAAAEQLAGVLRDPNGLDFAVGFVDGVVRPEDLGVAARNLRTLAPKAPAFLPWYMRRAVALGGGVAPAAPAVVVPIARTVLRRMVGHLIVDATPQRLGKAIASILRDGIRLNINLLGEAVLGSHEAQRRLDGTVALLQRDDVDYVSIKVSSTVAPHQPWAFEEAVEHVIQQLLPLYRVAATSATPKFINLDREEYRDLELTMAVFTRLLDREEFRGLEAGIVLQAYLPDALGAMQRLQTWSAARRAAGGAAIKVRLVKGANLPMERVEASLHGWPLATCLSKQDSDTNYKRVLAYALTPERVANVRVGVAGHNLFDVAFAWLLAQSRGAATGVEFEMLLGMAQQQAEVVRQDVGSLLLYTPVVQPKEFDVAIAYLIRRLEEGASTENFMSAVFELAESEPLFERERDRFLASLDALDLADPGTHRTQDRTQEPQPLPADRFEPTPDSDPAVPANQRWAAAIREAAVNTALGLDTVAAGTLGSQAELDAGIARALAAGPSWRDRSSDERARILHAAGDALERRRGELMTIAAAEAGKTLDQSDPEVSEAIDFAHYYAELGRALEHVDGAVAEPARLIVVTPPWNFPVAIPAGSTLAALASGAAVVIKPARVTARCAAVMVEALWEAGVPRDALQFVQFSDRELQSQLVANPAVDRVILTGGFETAEAFTALRPDVQLLAETSGKNAIIVTPNADYDLAVKDIVASAFGHAGQKCSAASLVVLVGQAARSKRIRNQLRDAVTSLRVGSPLDAGNQVGPIVQPAAGKLLEGLTTLGEGERWFVEPKQVDAEGRIWRPGVRSGVRRGSEYHRVEYFGPILGIMTAETLDEAIEIVNEVEYGLTSGLHSLDAGEIAHWLRHIQAGNLYVNRGITGAIVQRQPFGGWKKSVVGATTKAGGPNYLVGLVDWRPAAGSATVEPALDHVRALRDAGRALAGSAETRVLVSADEAASLARAVASDEAAWRAEFGLERDVQALGAERDVLRYLPAGGHVTVRLAEAGRVAELLRVVAAGLRAGAKLRVSTGVPLPSAVRAAVAGAGVPMTLEDDAAFAVAAGKLPAGRVRLVGGDRAALAQAIGGRCELAIYGQPVTEAGRIELLPFLREQAVAITAHRFGTRQEAMFHVLPTDA